MRVISSLEYFGFNESHVHFPCKLKMHVMGAT